MTQDIIKVCVRIPSERKSELLAFAEELRTLSNNRTQGWDAKEIHRIAKEHYGSLRGLYEHHGWPERGSDMMRNVQSHVKGKYGSIDNFVNAHKS
jgi:hypothetical protein